MSQTPPTPPATLPTPPQTNDPENFDARGDAFLSALPSWASQMISLAQNVYANCVDAFNSAVSAGNNAASAAASASAAALTAGAVPFNPATVYAQYASAVSLVNLHTYRRRFAGASATDPSNDPTNWASVVDPTSLPRVPRDAGTNASLSRGDSSKFIDVTSGSFTQAFDACATLGAGWFVFYANSGTGDVVLDPNLIETINGASTLLVQRGAILLITCDGVGLTAKVLAGATGYLKVSDQKASGANGGSLTVSTFNPRDLNTTEFNSINGASVGSNRITLPPGEYQVSGSAPASSGVSRHKAFLFNVTDSTYALNGTSIQCTSGADVTLSIFSGRFVITSSKVFEIRTWAAATQVGNGGGVAATCGQPEVYSQIEIRKVA